ncbi:DUF92 domain-containing protein [Methanocella arvoryzae]|uniref:TIGR00297 family protein n=1 Tax=Methanocella arvoryzae (strain DSM 22066 / NBRC 105507 / MRE50) TaxID=351160 RepID=Q0W5V3_METAR|nr:TIGR00297 family protein [Methanocella arvoryzae]CAJ36240.1 conserved hypothetical protein [Methanocella arvoryzae MRE50]
MYPGTRAGGAGRQQPPHSPQHSLKYELKRQSAYISLGLLALLFPFLPKGLIVLGVFIVTLIIMYMPRDSPVFKTLSSEKDRETGVLLGPLKFCFAILLLAILVMVLDFPVYVLSAVIGTVAFGEGVATIVTRLVKGDPAIFWSITLLVLGTAFAFLFGYWVIVNGGLPASINVNPVHFMFFLAVIGTVTGALLYTIVDEDDIAIPLGAGMAMWLFSSLAYSAMPDPAEIALAVAVPLAIGIVTYKLNAVDLSGALSGVLCGVLLIVFGGFEWFILLLAFLILGTIFTKYKYQYKRKVGAAESNQGSRGYKNVFGNCFVPLIFVVAYGVLGGTTYVPYLGYIDQSIFLIGFLGAMATATADTLASEIGSTYRGQPIMITTLRRVPPGTDGGVSPLGEAASIFGALAIAVIAIPLGLRANSVGTMVFITVLTGFLGTNIDSLFGATLQRRGLLSNAGVNFVATLFGGLFAMAVYYLFFM